MERPTQAGNSSGLVGLLIRKSVRRQVEGREKTYAGRKFRWMSRLFKPESSARTGEEQWKDLRKIEIQVSE